MSTCGNPGFGSTATRWCTLISGTQMLLLEATDNQPTSWLMVILRVLCSSSTKRYPPRPDFVEMGRELTVGCHKEQGNVRITVFSCSDISNPYSLSLVGQSFQQPHSPWKYYRVHVLLLLPSCVSDYATKCMALTRDIPRAFLARVLEINFHCQ